MVNTEMYIFKLNYSERLDEKPFIKDILNTFDSDELAGCGILVNNNPYNLELLLFASFIKNSSKFEAFLKAKYPRKQRLYNHFLDNMVPAIWSKGYNLVTFDDETSVDLIISENANSTFLFPSKSQMNTIWKRPFHSNNCFRVFLSHSSKDKVIVDKIFNELQKSEIYAWYDKYEIQPGDSITEKINEGLETSDVGIICISRNFLNTSSGWTKSELNYFVQRRMRIPDKTFLILNFDLPHDELPPLVQDYRYIDFKDPNAIEELIEILKKKTTDA